MFSYSGQQIVILVTKCRETLAVNNQRSHRFQMERFNLKKLNEVEGKKRKSCDEVSNGFAALEDLATMREYQHFSQRESRLL
jgi:hypothetical protein